MHVCICRNVNEALIRESVRAGIDSMPELMDKTGCGSQCGKCVPFAVETLKKELAMSAPLTEGGVA
jgi:bacterioferritin-associated ferredoxin